VEQAAGSLTKPQIMRVYHGTVQSMITVTETTSNVGRRFVLQLLRVGSAVRALTRKRESGVLLGDVDVMRSDLPIPDTPDACLDKGEPGFLVWSFFIVEAAPAFLYAATKHMRWIFYPLSEGVGDDREQPPYTVTPRTAAKPAS
jgi:hypothetical protein